MKRASGARSAWARSHTDKPATGIAFYRVRRDREEFLRILNRSTALMANYIVGNLVVSIIAGIVTYVGLRVLGVLFPSEIFPGRAPEGHVVLTAFAGGALAQNEHEASGSVVRANPAKGQAMIQHEPVASLNWPGMTMGFDVTDKALFDKVQAIK